MKIYDAREFQDLLDSMTKRTTEISEPLLNLEQAVKAIVSLDSFTGNGPDALKAFYQNSHLPLLRYWQTTNDKRTSLISTLKNTALNFDPHPDAYVNEAFIEGEVIPAIDRAKQRAADSADRINAIAESVSDIISLPAFDDSDIQDKLHKARQHAQVTVEKLHAFDYQATSTVTQFAELLNPIKTYVSNLEGAITSSKIHSAADLTAITLNTDMPAEIMAMHHNPNQMRTILTMYSDLKAQTPQMAMSMAMNPMGAVQWFNPYAYGLAQRMMLAGGHIDVVNHFNSNHKVAGMSVDADGNEINNVNNGQIVNDWGDGHIEAKGAQIDIQAIKDSGVRVSMFTTVSGHEINYAVVNGELLVFRDNPDVHYYTNGYVQTRANQYISNLTMIVGGYGVYKAGRSVVRGEWRNHSQDGSLKRHLKDGGNWKERGEAQINRRPKNDTVVMQEVKDKTIMDEVLGKVKGAAAGFLPIVGTEIPKAGSQEVIIWLSDDEGETWETKVHVQVNSNGAVTIEDYEDKRGNWYDGFIDLFRDDKNK